MDILDFLFRTSLGITILCVISGFILFIIESIYEAIESKKEKQN